MIDVSATIEEMQVCGMSADAIILALKSLRFVPLSTDAQAERRRAADRARKADARLRNSADKTSPKEKSPIPPKENTTSNTTNTREEPEGEAPQSRVSRGTRIPPGFQPHRNVLQDARNRGLTDPEITDQLERFRDWAEAATGQVAIKRDWDAACRNWLRRAADEKRNRNARFNKPSPASDLANAFAGQRADLAARFGDGGGEGP